MREAEDNKVAKYLGLKNEVNKAPLSDNALIMHEIDKDIFQDYVERYPIMQENMDAGLKEYAPFSHLSEDIFNSLFKYSAKLHDAEDVKAFSQFNHELMSEVLESEEYDNLRKNTKFDPMASAIGTELLQSKSMEKIQYFKEQLRIQNETGQAMPGADAGELINQLNNVGNIQNGIDDFISGIPGGKKGMTAKEAKKLANMQSQLKDAQKAIDKNTKGQDEFVKEMSDKIDEAVSEAQTIVGDVRNVVDQWGLDGGVSGRRISLEQRRKAIERVRRSPRLKNLTDLIGRFKKIASSKKKQTVKNGHSIASVTTGDRIEDIIPSEWSKLNHPILKKDFYKRFSEKQLLQYVKNDIKSRGRGPVCVLHDKSSSMNGDGKDDWSTALALAMLEVAQKDKRNYAYIPYNGMVMHQMVKDIPAGELDPDDIMDIAELSPTGGTNFEYPLKLAMEFIEKSSYKKADILFITDGDASISDDFLKRFKTLKEDKKFFVHTVLINIGYGGASRATVETFSDHITTISNVADLDEANASAIFKMTESSSDITDAADAALPGVV